MKLKYKRGTNPNSHKPTKLSNDKRKKKLKGRTWTETQNKKRSETLMGHKHSEKTIKKIKQSLKEKFPDGKPLNSGNFTSERMKGKNNPNWRGGILLNIYSKDWKECLKNIIKERDDKICQICGIKINGPRRIKSNPSKNWLVVHHIDYNKKNSNSENLITLCDRCHKKTNFNRKDWIKYFTGGNI